MTDLDPQQQAAVDAGPVDLFISAGAGSGKTRVLVSRFVHAVLGIPPYVAQEPGALLTVTYTEKAAGELAERIRVALIAAGRTDAARRVGEGWISTIHGMCARILRQHAFDAGLDPHFAVLDEADASVLEVDAFEEAVRPLVEADADVAALVDACGLDVVMSAAHTIRADVRALGLTTENVLTLGEQEVTSRFAELSAAFADLARDLGALRGPTTVRKNAAAAQQAAEATMSGFAGVDGIDAHALLERLSALRMSHYRTAEGHEALVDSGKHLLEEARACAAQLAVRPLESAMLEVTRAFEARYDLLKRERGALDFEDLQTATAALLERRPDIAAQYRNRFAMIMIDEFQDTNELQTCIVDRIARANLCTVGDGNQSIYAFRHADVEVFRRRERTIERQAVLDTNYRTEPALVRTLNGLFSRPVLFGPGHVVQWPPEARESTQADKLEAAAKRGRGAGRNRPTPDGADSDQASTCELLLVDWSAPAGRERAAVEAAGIGLRCSELVEEGFAPGQIAVLMAAMRGGRAEAVERSLLARGIPAFLSSGGSFFACDEVAEVRALLRAVDNVRDDEALATVLGGRLTGLSDDALYRIGGLTRDTAATAARGQRSRGLWAALDEAHGLISPDDTATLARTIEAIAWARRQRGFRPLAELISRTLLRLDADLVLLASGPGGTRAWANVLKLVRMADEFERVSGGDVRAFIEYLALRELHATSEQEAVLQEETDAVRVMSIHAAKGLEFPAVIVGGISRSGTDSPVVSWSRVSGTPLLAMRMPTESGSVPTTASLAVRTARENVRQDEAKRLLYVACTRAERSLTLVGLTDPGKDAEDSLIGLVRRALGMDARGTVSEGPRQIGEGSVTVRIAPGTRADEELTGAPPRGSDTPLAHLQPERRSSVASPGAPVRVSYTGLALYESCAYRFYLTHIARLKAPPETPGGDGDPLAFGRAVHAVLERTSSELGPPDGLIEQIAAGCGLAYDEVPRVRRAVDAFLASPAARDAFSAERVMHEVPMAVPLRGVALGGVIDLLAWWGHEAVIVDFKTGTGARSAAEAEERYRLQGTCYALAALAAEAVSVRVVFAELETGRVTEYHYTSADRASLEETVGTVVDRVAAGEFRPREAYDPVWCEQCPGYRGLCPVRPMRAGAAV